MAGFVPSIITAVFDRMLDRRGGRGIAKYLLTGICGYVTTYLRTIENAFEVTPLIPEDAKWRLVGLFPAITSWSMETVNSLLEE